MTSVGFLDKLRRTGEPPEKTRVAFVDVVRALAAILVVYSHLDWVFLQGRHVDTPVFRWLDNWFSIPLGFGDQGPGGISVPAFFMISGFVVTPIAMRMGSGRFAVNRLLRVFPLMFFAVAVAVGVVLAGGSPLTTGNPNPVTVSKVISNALLYNFLQKPLDSYVAVAWTLLIEVMFYLLLIALAPLLRKMPWMAIVIQFNLIIAVLITHDWFGPNYAAFASNVAYLVIPIMGQILWAGWNKKIPAPLAGAFFVVCWMLYLWAARAHMDANFILRPWPIAAALVVVLIGLFAENHLRQRKAWTVISERSFSIYLLHGVIAFPIMQELYTEIPVPFAVLISLAATAVGVELAYRFVERPSHVLARKLSRSNLLQRKAGAPKPTGKPQPVAAPRHAAVPEPNDAERTVRIPVVRESPSRVTREVQSAD